MIHPLKLQEFMQLLSLQLKKIKMCTHHTWNLILAHLQSIFLKTMYNVRFCKFLNCFKWDIIFCNKLTYFSQVLRLYYQLGFIWVIKFKLKKYASTILMTGNFHDNLLYMFPRKTNKQRTDSGLSAPRSRKSTTCPVSKGGSVKEWNSSQMNTYA